MHPLVEAALARHAATLSGPQRRAWARPPWPRCWRGDRARAADGASRGRRRLPGLPHFPAKAKRVIYLFQSGAPSQLDLFDYKPTLEKFRGQDLPDRSAWASG